jgi:dTDP-4-amino-4,6-dideoxygalactose transaminase
VSRVGFRELGAVARVIARGRLNRGEKIGESFLDRFEMLLAQQIGAKHVLTVNSGTSALICALVAAEIGPGDEVLVPAYSWISTALAPLAVGAVPILVDIDESLTIDIEDIKRKINPHTRAIIPVHMQNLVCNMDAIMAIAREHQLVVIEDACQAVGVSYKNRRVGTIGDVGVFSFNHHKNLNSGEGGALITNNDRLFSRARIYHDVGNFTRPRVSESSEPIFSGVNFRVSELTGAVLYAQRTRLDSVLKGLRKRREVLVRQLEKSNRFRICPHHDPQSAIGLSVLFERPAEARVFASNRGVTQLISTGRHVYTNWEALLSRRSFDDRMNPFKWAHREISYTPETCRRTLDILERTCRIGLGGEFPLPLVRVQAWFLLRSAAKQPSDSYLTPSARPQGP